MRTIWEFPLEIQNEQEIDIPTPNRILSIQTQNNTPYIWLIVDPEGPKEKIKIYCYGTGHPMNLENIGPHLGTVQVDGGKYVFHFFNSKERREHYL